MPDIPSVVLNQIIDPDWGTLVADTLDDVQADIVTLNGGLSTTNANLATEAANVDTLQAQMATQQAATARQGGWWSRVGAQGITTTLATIVPDTLNELAGAWSNHSGGVVTVPSGQDGVYAVFAKFSYSGALSVWITLDGSFDVLLPVGFDTGGGTHSAGTITLRMNAAQNVRIRARSSSGTVNVTGGWHVWRVSA